MNTINLGGKDRPVAFGFGAILRYENSTGKGVMSLLSEFANGGGRFSDLVFMLVCALENGSKKSGQYETFNVEQVAEWLDNHSDPGGVMKMLMLSLAEALPKSDEDAKKKEIAPESE